MATNQRFSFSMFKRGMSPVTFVLKIINVILLLAVATIFIFPFFWMLTTAFKTLAETMYFPPVLLPSHLQWENFSKAWNSGPFMTYTINSLIVTFSVLLLQMITVTFAAYAFAKKKFKGSGFLFSLILSGLMMPAQVTFLPVYVMLSKVKLIDSLWAMILPFFGSSFGTFLMTQTYKQISDELVESAKLDGAGELKTLARVIMPMAKSTYFTFGLFGFVYHWNNYFWAIIMTSTSAHRTLPVGIAQLTNADTIKDWQIIMAGNVIQVLPILFFYLLANQYIKTAFTYNGVK